MSSLPTEAPERNAPSAARPATTWWVPMVLVLALACVLALVVGGAAAPLDLGDPGPLVRWGAPIVRGLHDLAAATAIGAFLLGGLLMPEGARSHRRRETGRIGAWSTLAWGLSGVLGGMLGFAALSDAQFASAGFVGQWWSATWQLELLRAPAITSFAALALGLVAWVDRGRNAQAWLFFGSCLSLLPLALVGHAANAVSHDASVNSLAFHLVGAAIWVGGLVAVLMMWPTLGSTRAAVVGRFSQVATWCFVAVALSGLLNATVRLGEWSALGTRYGVLVLAKTVALLVLGGFGYLQRQRVVTALNQDSAPSSRQLFVRLTSSETLVMAATFGLATALARTPPPLNEAIPRTDVASSRTGYPMPADFTVTRLLFDVRIEWLFATVSLVAVGVYLVWVRRLHRRGDSWPIGRTLAWVSGWLLFGYVLNSGISIYGRVMFSVHMLEHMLISMLVPILLVLAAPVTLALRAAPKRRDATLGPRELVLATVHSPVLRVLANPVVAAALFFLSLVVFYYSPLFALALQTHTGHVLMTVHFLLTGYLFVWSLIGIDPGPPKWPGPMRLLVLLVTLAGHAFFGVALMSGTTLLAPEFFRSLQLPWVPEPLADQQAAGGVAWAVGELPTLVLAILVTFDWLRRDTAQGRRAERQADRDDDAELRAYNAYLSSLERPRSGERQSS